MTDREILAEALAAANAHVNAVNALARPVMDRIRSAAMSGSPITRSEIASAGLLSQEIDKAQARVERLRAEARERAGSR